MLVYSFDINMTKVALAVLPFVQIVNVMIHTQILNRNLEQWP